MNLIHTTFAHSLAGSHSCSLTSPVTLILDRTSYCDELSANEINYQSYHQAPIKLSSIPSGCSTVEALGVVSKRHRLGPLTDHRRVPSICLDRTVPTCTGKAGFILSESCFLTNCVLCFAMIFLRHHLMVDIQVLGVYVAVVHGSVLVKCPHAC